MKFVVRFQRRYSVMITIIACASAIWLMVKRFGFPEDKVLSFLLICLLLLAVVIIVAVPLAFVLRWWTDRRGS